MTVDASRGDAHDHGRIKTNEWRLVHLGHSFILIRPWSCQPAGQGRPASTVIPPIPQTVSTGHCVLRVLRGDCYDTDRQNAPGPPRTGGPEGPHYINIERLSRP